MSETTIGLYYHQKDLSVILSFIQLCFQKKVNKLNITYHMQILSTLQYIFTKVTLIKKKLKIEF